MSWEEEITEMAYGCLEIADQFEAILNRLRGEEERPEIFEAVHRETVRRWP